MKINYQEELKNCDTIKVLMMLSIILYHSMVLWTRSGWFNQSPVHNSILLTYLATWLNTFHIYVFTFVSGYLFYYLKYECGMYTDFKEFSKKKLKRLIVPYVFAAGLWCIPFHVYFFKPSVTDLVSKYFFAFSPSQLWFLVMLFVLSLGFYLLAEFANNQKFIYMVVMFSLIYFGSYIIGRFIPNIFQIITAMKYSIFYYLGFALRKYKPSILYKINYGVYLLINVILFSLFLRTSINDTILYRLATILIQPVLNISGVLMIFIGVNKFGYLIKTESELFGFFKKYNFTMYLVHQQIIYIVINLFNGIVNPYVLVILNFSISISIAGIISVLLNKFSLMRANRITKFEMNARS